MPLYHKQNDRMTEPVEVKLTDEAIHQLYHVKKKPKAKASLQDNQALWFMKKEKNIDNAAMEVLSAEFFRLIIGESQPKTRLFANNKIISKAVPGFKSLENVPDFWQGVENGRYSNAGLISVIALFLNETDNKSDGNLGLDENNHVVKLDCGWCFAKTRMAKYPRWPSDPGYHRWLRLADSQFTDKDISSLPFLSTYRADQWFDLVSSGEEEDNPMAARVTNSPFYRSEVHLGILRILLIPDDYFEQFVISYIGKKKQDKMLKTKLILELKSRKTMLQTAAFENPSFKAFMASDEAHKELAHFTKSLDNFVTYGHKKIKVSRLQKKCQKRFGELKNTFYPPSQQPFVKKFWKGLSGGGVVGLATVLSFILLRMIDLATLGLSLPITITLNILMVLGATLCGSILGLGIQHALDFQILNDEPPIPNSSPFSDNLQEDMNHLEIKENHDGVIDCVPQDIPEINEEAPLIVGPLFRARHKSLESLPEIKESHSIRHTI